MFLKGNYTSFYDDWWKNGGFGGCLWNLMNLRVILKVFLCLC